LGEGTDLAVRAAEALARLNVAQFPEAQMKKPLNQSFARAASVQSFAREIAFDGVRRLRSASKPSRRGLSGRRPRGS
jgi:hypothetical protein